jgi:hypothetical protein
MFTAPIFLVIGGIFLMLAGVRIVRGGDWRHPQTRTWLLMGAIFLLVAVVLRLNR